MDFIVLNGIYDSSNISDAATFSLQKSLVITKRKVAEMTNHHIMYYEGTNIFRHLYVKYHIIHHIHYMFGYYVLCVLVYILYMPYLLYSYSYYTLPIIHNMKPSGAHTL